MSFTVLIPARLASTRLPGKPLLDVGGLPMVVRVAHQARRSGASRIVVAADHDDIVRACTDHGVMALLTRTDHATGSDRLAEACALLALADDALVVNVQGDEPLIEPGLIDATAAALARHEDCVMSTAAHALDTAQEFLDTNVVKVVIDAAGRALYFSRAPLPWWRDGYREGVVDLATPAPLRHVGIYAYRCAFLKKFPQLAPSPLEVVEALEQLRVLWHGARIAVHVSAMRPGPGVDTPQDLERVRRWLAGAPDRP